MGHIIKVHDQVFATPMTEVERQAKAMGDRYIGAKNPLPMPDPSYQAFLMRQDRRLRAAK